MKKILTENLGFKLAAVLCAILLWMVVVNVNNPVGTEKYTVTVTMENASTVTDAGMVYSILDNTDTVTVTVKAQRSVLRDLEASDLSVVADFNDITQMNTVPLQVSSKRYSSKIERYTLDHSNLKVEIEEGMTKEFNVELKTTGTPKEGYAIGEKTATPNIITVSGPASVVENIVEIRATVSVDNRNATLRRSAAVTAFDENGQAVSSERLTFSQKEVLASISFLETKSVSLKVGTTGTCASGYRLEEAVSSPTTITIAGKSAELAGIESITLPESLLDITDASEDVKASVDISRYLPEGVRLTEGQKTTVELTARIAPLETMELSIPVSEINLMNTPVNMQADFGNINSITITLKGTQEDLDALDTRKVSASVDLSDLPEGVHRVDVIVTTPENIYTENNIWIDVGLWSTLVSIEEPYNGGE